MRFRLRYIAAVAAIAISSPASAVVLDWDTATWTNGATTGSVNGVDVKIATSAPGLFTGSSVTGNPPTPAVTRAFDGGLAVGEKTLEIALDLPRGGSSSFVTVTFTFNAATYANGVMGLSFAIFDIDAANSGGSTYQDRIFNVTATTIGGATLLPTFSNLGSAVTLSGVDLIGNASAPDTGAGSGAGNAQINFNASFIRSITFSYGSTNAFSDPTYQHIGIHDLTFTPVPEINPAWTGVLSCLLASGLVLRHRKRCRRK